MLCRTIKLGVTRKFPTTTLGLAVCYLLSRNRQRSGSRGTVQRDISCNL